jgi:hypothetical protein
MHPAYMFPIISGTGEALTTRNANGIPRISSAMSPFRSTSMNTSMLF